MTRAAARDRPLAPGRRAAGRRAVISNAQSGTGTGRSLGGGIEPVIEFGPNSASGHAFPTDRKLQPGMAYTVEPGIYLTGEWDSPAMAQTCPGDGGFR